MKQAMLRSGALAAVVLLAALAFLVISIETTRAEPSPVDGPAAAVTSGASTTITWTRTLEPVVIAGDQFPEYISVTLSHLFVYSYTGSAWQQIPYQFDEVNASGEYTTTEGGLLDANDELVFMAKDVGYEAPRYGWLPDPDAELYPRYAISVTNPLTPFEIGWVYLYRSATLSPTITPTEYITWNGATNRLTATTYIAGWDPSTHFLMDSLELNGTGVDVLDRQKMRMNLVCKTSGGGQQTFTATEESSKDEYRAPTVVGPVRVGSGSAQGQSWYYASAWQGRSELDYSAFPPNSNCPGGMDFKWTRQSTDWISPTLSGMAPMTYWDSITPNGVQVDGIPDDIPTTPLVTWRQVSGALGSVVTVQSLSALSGTLINYYYDDMVPNTNDTGDQESYADAGFRMDGTPNMGVLTTTATTYVLGPNQPKAGITYQSYFTSPLSITVTEQGSCVPLSEVDFGWSPTPAKQNEVTTLTASIGGGSRPYEYTWSFGDDGSSATGASVSHTFGEAGTFTVTLTVDNPCGQSVVSKPVLVTCDPVTGTSFTWEPATPKAGEQVSFQTQPSGTNPISLTWDFGDGTYGTGLAPSHTYGAAGTYTVMLTGTNPCGSETTSSPVTVLCDNVAGLSMTRDLEVPRVFDSVTFGAHTTGGATPITFDWDFGDGAQATGPTPSHTYTVTGTYTVILTGTNLCGPETTSSQVTVTCDDVAGLSMTRNPQTPEVFQSVTFNAQTTGGTPDITFQWNFGDGSSGSGATVSHTYTRTGSYSVALTAINPCGQKTIRSTVQVICNPLSGTGFTWQPTTPEVDNDVTFDATATGTTPFTFTWDFGDGSQGEGDPITHRYSDTGPHTVILTITNPCDSKQHTGTVNVICNALTGVAFSWDPATPEIKQLVRFSAQASGTAPISFAWDFGDGSVGSGANPTHTYSEAGTYTVKLTARNPCGSVALTKTIEVICRGVTGLDMSWQPANPEIQQSVAFAATTTGGMTPITFAWDFGDGSTGSGANASHTYSQAGSYTVKLTATNPCGDFVLTRSIEVICRGVTGLDMSWQPQNPEIQQSVAFAATTTGGMTPITFAWDFGDGSTGSGANPSHTYSQAGTYSVKLTATNPCGDTLLTRTIQVTCRAITGLDMSWQPETPFPEQEVSFSATTTGGMTPITFAWDFGDGTTGSGANPTHTYNETGSYTVKLTATNPCGEQVLSRTINVTCDRLHDLALTWDPTIGEVQNPVTFSAQASGSAPIAFAWDFGDDSTGSGANPTHTYSEAGSYTLTLTVTNPCDEAVLTDTISVVCNALSGVNLSWQPATPEVRHSVTFSAQASGTAPITFAWDFGDGSTGSGANPTHTYSQAGTYSVKLTATNPCGDEVVTETITVVCNALTGTALSWEPTTPEIQELVTFSAQASGTEPITFTWDFGDGSAASGDSPTHTYDVTGTYDIVLTATNPCGNQVVSDSLTVICVEVAGLSMAWDPQNPEIQQSVAFTATTTGGMTPITFAWDFGDGFTGSGANPTHTYSEGGSYTVTLTAANPCGDKVLTETITVACNTPTGTALSWEPTTPEIQELVTFSAQASGTEPITFAWDFGDGSTASGDSPTHTYDVTGTYDIVLTATNPCGNQMVTDSVTVICVEVAGLSMTWEPENPEIQQSVAFTATTTGGMTPITFAWDFGDGSTGSGANPTHTYDEADSYTVTLTATNPCGDKVLTQIIEVTCSEVTGLDLSWEPESPEMQQSVAFTATTTGGMTPITFAWEFGDGSRGSGASPTHTYQVTGTYDLVLTATNPCGNKVATGELTVVCNPLTALDFSWSPSPPMVGQEVTFSASGTGTGPMTYNWQFADDESTATGAVVTHSFAEWGTYQVTLTGRGTCGPAQTQAHSIEVKPAAYTYLPLILKASGSSSAAPYPAPVRRTALRRGENRRR